MSNLSSFNIVSDTISDANKIVSAVGEVIPVLTDNGTSNGTQPSVIGDFVRSNTLQSASSFPDLLKYFKITPTFTAVTSGTANAINSIRYLNGSYIYAGASGVLATSTDAITWTARTSGTASAINSLAYGNSVYVYTGVGGVVGTSTNATSWTAVASALASSGTAIDYSLNQKTLTLVGSAQLSTTQSKSGNYSLYLNNATNADGITTPHNTGFNLDSGDFTIECWVYISSGSGSDKAVITKGFGSVYPPFLIYYGIYSELSFWYSTTGTSWTGSDLRFVTGAPSNTWIHLAASRVGSNLYLFYNGTLALTHNIGALSLVQNSYDLTIGRSSTGHGFQGYIDDVRVTKGVGRYSTSFTPPGPLPDSAAADASFSNVSLLLKMDPSKTFADLSSVSNTLTATGNVRESITGSKSGSGSIYFDGSGDYISASTSSAFGFGTGDFTVEAWVKTTSKNVAVIETRSADHAGIFITSPTTGRIGYYDPSVGVISGTTDCTTGVWNHLAWSRSGTTFRMFVNGTQEYSGTLSSDFGTSRPLRIAANYLGNDALNGNIESIRVTKGIARYTTNFTPVNDFYRADPYYANTVLLLDGDNQNNNSTTFKDRSLAANTVTPVSGAKISNVVKKYGTGSIQLNGSTDYLTIPSSADWAYGTGDFTIEFWANWTAVSSTIPGTIIAGTVNGTTLAVYITSTAMQIARNNVGGDLTVSSTQTTGVWNHYAFVRSSGTGYIFKDGILLGSGPVGTNFQQSSLIIGAGSTGTSYVNGYLDDIRITKGIARYTANFTPPSPHHTGNDQYYSNTSLLISGIPSDNINITIIGSGTTSTVNSIIYEGNKFVYGSNGGVIGTSTNGTTWSLSTSGTTSNIQSIGYGNALYFYGGAGGVLATSTDAITWTARTSGTTSQINSVVFGNGVYMYAGVGGVLATSSDGITWVRRASGTTSQINSISYDNGIFAYSGNTGAFGISYNNGLGWTTTTSGTTNNIISNAIVNDTHIYGAAGGVLARATENTTNFIANITPNLKATNITGFDLSKSLTYYVKGKNTTYSEYPLGAVIQSKTLNKLQVPVEKFIAAPGVYYKSQYPDLFAQIGSQVSSPFTPSNSVTTSEIKALAFGNSLYAYGGVSGAYATSTDAITWTTSAGATTNTIFSVVYGSSAGFVRAGWNGYLASSTSGTAWSSGHFYSLEYGNSLYVAGASNGLLVTSTNATTWTYRQSGTTSTIRSIIYAGGIYVYGTTGGGIATSTDAITWTQRTSGTTSNIYSIAYGGGLYTYVGHGGVIGTSTDAITWTQRTSGTTAALGSVTYGNSRFVAVGNTASRYSTDGITWTASGLSSALYIKVVYGNSIFLAIHSGQQINWTSVDGITWTQRSNAYYANQTSLAFGGGIFVLATDWNSATDPNYATEYTNPYRADTQGYIQTSTDGITWTARGQIITPNSNHMVYDGVSKWVTVHDNFISSSSTSPTTAWTAVGLNQSGTSSTIYSLTFGNNLYTYAGNGGMLATSTDALTWTARTSGTTSTIYTSIYGGAKYVYAGVGGCLGYSTDGVSWITGSGTGTSSNLTSIIYAGTRYYYTGTGGLLSYSSDGTSWTAVTTGTTQQINKIEFLNGTYFYVANGGVLATSSDGITWVLRTTGVTGDLVCITWDGTRYVANGNSLISSTDGITWTVNWPGGSTGKVGPEHSAYFGAPFNLHIGVGYTNQIVTSSNGQIWQKRTVPTTSGGIWHANYNSSLIIAVGDGGVILTSTDGITWTQRTSGTTQALNGVVWNGTFWVIVGNGGVIITSTDGTTWTARTSGTTTALWGVEATQTKTIAYTGTGVIFTSNHADCAVWTSSTVTSSAPYSHAYSPTLNMLALGYQNGIWTSSDNGTTWTNRGNGNNWFGACWTGSYFCFVGYSILKSSDGVNWTSITNPSNIELVGTHHDGTALYVMSTYNYGYPIMRSTDDGTTWKTALICGFGITNVATNGAGQFVYSRNQTFQTKYNAIVATNAFGYDGTDRVVLQSSGYSADYANVKYLNNRYLVTGGGSSFLRVQSSTDGITWTLATFGTAAGVRGVTYYSGLYVAAVDNGSIYTSTDAITWTARTTGTTTALNTIAVNGTGRYVAVGNTGVLVYSTDAINWSLLASIAKFSGTTSNINALAYGNSVYLYAGAGGMLATSTDLITWTARTSGTTSAINALTYGNGVFTYYATGGIIATSTDGITWTPRSSATVSQINAAVYDGTNLTVYAGIGGVLARSSNPTVLTYSPIYDHQSQFYVPAVSFNNTNLAYVRAIP